VRYYAVLPDGLQPISPVLAAILRNTNAYGLDQPPRLSADVVAKLPVSRMLDTARYPDQQITLVDAAKSPVTCASWSKPAGAATSSLSLLSGSAVPVPDSIHTVDLVGGGAQGTATRVALPPGTGLLHPDRERRSILAGRRIVVLGVRHRVRYGIDNESESGGHGKTVEALGLIEPPSAIPWSMLSLFATGPTLSRADALLAHDGLAPDSRPGRPASAEGERDEPPDLRSPTARCAAKHAQGMIAIEAPPELPRVIPPSLLRRALPVVIVMLIVGMVVALFATGMRVISPQTLFFPFVLLLAATALYRGTGNKMRTEEVDAERADYLRYLSVIRDNIRTQAAQQRAAAQVVSSRPHRIGSRPRISPSVGA